MRHPWLILAAAFALLFSTASAQEFVLQRYELDSLGSRPGKITLSPNFLSLIEFESPVQSAATGRSDLINVSVDGHRIILRPVRSVGRTDLIVTVEGKTALFTINIDEQVGQPRRYLIVSPQPMHEHATPSTSSASRQTSRLSSPIGVPLPAQERTRPQATNENRPSLDDELAERGIDDFEPDAKEEEAAKAETEEVVGESIPFTFEATVAKRTPDEVIINYGIDNGGENTIANDSSRLRVLDDEGESVAHTIVRMNPDGAINRIAPGVSEYGVLRIPNPPEGDLHLEWPIVEIGPGVTYTIDDIVLEVNDE